MAYTRLSQVAVIESATESPSTSSLTSTGDTSPPLYSSSFTTKSSDPPQAFTTTTSPTRTLTPTAKLATSAGTGGSSTVGTVQPLALSAMVLSGIHYRELTYSTGGSNPQSEPVKSQSLSRSNLIVIAVILSVVGLLILSSFSSMATVGCGSAESVQPTGFAGMSNSGRSHAPSMQYTTSGNGPTPASGCRLKLR